MMITCEEALDILTESDSFDLNLLNRANEVRKKYQGDKVDLCSIINVKSGRCSEDCAYCAQSSFHHTDIKKYAL
ncbi:MAG: biotin synthase BioB, partial [bacterium]